MTSSSSVLQGFVPSQLVRWLAARPRADGGPVSAEERLVVWAADLSDFSRLTNEITDAQRAGPEIVTDLLNEIFGTIIETIHRHGGEVLGFGGDSVFATWAVGEDRDEAEAVVQAGLCGLAVHEIEPAAHGQRPPVRLKIGVGLGTCSLMQVGGFEGHWHFLIGGSPVQQMGEASSIADSGEVVLSPVAYRAARDRLRGVPRVGGFVQLADVDPSPTVRPAPAVVVPGDLTDIVRSFLSPPVVARIDAGHTEWLAEFRRVTSLFINLPTLDLASPAAREALQEAVTATQRSLATYEGSLTRILADEKGVTLIAAFGLPPLAHEEDPYRAIQAAKEIQDALRELRLDYGIGIATGRAYCGSCGSASRRDYTTIGREVNLAARLMQAARFEILCDVATAQATRRIEFHEVGPMPLKGWDQPVRAFRPLWDKVTPHRDQRDDADRPHLVGRASESGELNALLDSLDRTGSSAVVVIEGEAGIGKTALIADLLQRAKDTGIRCLFGAAEPVAQAPYHAWREVLEEVLGITGVVSVERRQTVVRERLMRHQGFSGREALLNPVLRLQFPESDSTRGMSGTNRRESTVELIVSLLAEAAANEPLLIALDDAHWFDSASWAVALAVAQKVSPIMLVISTRPQIDQSAPVEDLAELDGFTRFALVPIGREPSLQLARELLDAEELAADVASLITESAEGVPFFIQELVHSLVGSNALVVENGVARLDRLIEDVDVPHSLSSLVLSRIDRLPPQLQLTVKVASVIGRSFDVDVLAAAHPDRPGTDELEDELGQLARLDLIERSSEGVYDFRHSLIRDAAYELLVFDQRRRIHADVGRFIEAQVTSEVEPPYSLLAHHWDRGADPRRALTYLEKTGAGALRKGANHEAIEAHSRSFALVAAQPEEFGDVTPLRKSGWLVDMGQAYEALGELDDAVASLYRALELLEVKAPTNPVRRVGRLMWEMAKQAIHIALPKAVRVPPSMDERIRLAQASRVAALIGQIYYFTVDLSGFPVLNLMAINLGEKAGEPIVAGLAYSNLGYILGTLRLRRLASRYFRLTRLAGDHMVVRELVDTPEYLDLYEMTPGHLIAVSLSESVLALTFGEWDRAREIVDEGLERCAAMGDNYSAGIALAVRGFGSYSTGNLDEAASDYQRLLLSAVERANRAHEGWATSFVVPVLLAQDRFGEADAMAAAATRILDDVDPLTVPIIHGTKAHVLARSGHTEAAIGSAEAALAAIDSTPIFTYLAGFAGLLDALFELWEQESEGKSDRVDRLSDLTASSLKTMRAFALALPFARPKYRLYQGRMARLNGRDARAQRLLGKGLALAEDRGFTWDAGLLHLELAQTLPPTSAERQRHAAEARRLFVEVGSTHDLERLAAL